MICKYVLPFCELFSLVSFETQSFQLHEVQCIFLSLPLYLKKTIALLKFIPIFSTKGFMVLALTFR